jgi:CRISPR-associated protein Cas5h
MEIISFDVCGKLAHFRKYYANNTAFTYSMPPRTTVMGMLAAVVGYGRDAYYERLVSAHLRVGVRVLRPVKKTFHRLNFLSIKSRGDALEGTGDFTGAGGRIQTPFEVVSGLHLGQDFVAYRIFLAPGVDDNGEFSRLKTALGLSETDVLSAGQTRFNLTLGTANFSAWMENAHSHGDIMAQTPAGLMKIHSAVPSEKIVRLDFQKDDPDDGYNYLEEELMPADFVADGNRELSKLLRVLFSTQGKPFLAELNVPFFAVPDTAGELQNILFLE